MTVKTMADHAGQVVVGTIASTRSYWAANPKRIESEVTLRDVEFLKGRRSRSTASLTFTLPGGRVGTTTMKLGCAPAFLVGEKWMLFLLPTYKTFPVVGIAEGALRIEPDEEGVERVHTASGEVVTGLDSAGFVRLRGGSAGSAARARHASHGTNLVQPAGGAGGDLPAVESRAFINAIRPMLAASKEHQLSSSAGQRATGTPTPLVAMPLQTSAEFEARVFAGSTQPRSFARQIPSPAEVPLTETPVR